MAQTVPAYAHPVPPSAALPASADGPAAAPAPPDPPWVAKVIQALGTLADVSSVPDRVRNAFYFNLPEIGGITWLQQYSRVNATPLVANGQITLFGIPSVPQSTLLVIEDVVISAQQGVLVGGVGGTLPYPMVPKLDDYALAGFWSFGVEAAGRPSFGLVESQSAMPGATTIRSPRVMVLNRSIFSASPSGGRFRGALYIGAGSSFNVVAYNESANVGAAGSFLLLGAEVTGYMIDAAAAPEILRRAKVTRR